MAHRDRQQQAVPARSPRAPPQSPSCPRPESIWRVSAAHHPPPRVLAGPPQIITTTSFFAYFCPDVTKKQRTLTVAPKSQRERPQDLRRHDRHRRRDGGEGVALEVVRGRVHADSAAEETVEEGSGMGGRWGRGRLVSAEGA